jgi:hypothetical protein
MKTPSIASELYFGDARDPFKNFANTQARPFSMAERLAGDIVRFLTYKASDVEVAQLRPGMTLRTLEHEASAPFEVRHEVFVAIGSPLPENCQIRGNEPIAIRIQDICEDDVILRRWMRMTRSNGQSFGVCGVSQQLTPGIYEQWDALTASIGLENGMAVATLWGESADGAVRLPPDNIADELYYDAYLYALDASLYRNLPD